MTTNRRAVALSLLGGLFVALLAGCGSSPTTYPVAGRVVFADQTPVVSGVVEFAPVDGGPAARGKIVGDGRFTLQTGTSQGAAAGEHRVIVLQTFVTDGAAEHVHKGHTARVVDKKYGRFETSGLRRTVQSSGDNEFVFEVTPAPKKEPAAGWGR